MERIPYLEMVGDITEDYSAPTKLALVDLIIRNPHSLIMASDQTIVGSTEDSPIAVKTKYGTCRSRNLNPDGSMVSYNTATNQPPTNASANVNSNANAMASENANANAMKAATKTQPTTKQVLMQVGSKMQIDAESLHGL